jgi:nitrogen regulatory protein P-II 1
MKKVEAIIREERFDSVKSALESEGFISLTCTEVRGRGQQRGLSLQWRVGEYRVDLLPKLKVEIVARDEDVSKIVDIICDAARTGDIGDGMIFVTPVEQICRVRTGETREAALPRSERQKIAAR